MQAGLHYRARLRAGNEVLAEAYTRCGENFHPRLELAIPEEQHQNFYELMKKHQVSVEAAFGAIRFETGLQETANGGGGKAPKFALLTEDHATFLVTTTRNAHCGPVQDRTGEGVLKCT
jgi:hypothetical protein